MLYTGRGDTGRTSFFGESKRSSKASLLAEALGSCDELGSYLGLCKVKSHDCHIKLQNLWLDEIIRTVQGDLFIIQASLAGAEPAITEDKIRFIEELIHQVEGKFPPTPTFIIGGGSEISALLASPKTLPRKPERRVVALKKSAAKRFPPQTPPPPNRLSSLLYALARYTN